MGGVSNRNAQVIARCLVADKRAVTTDKIQSGDEWRAEDAAPMLEEEFKPRMVVDRHG